MMLKKIFLILLLSASTFVMAQLESKNPKLSFGVSGLINLNAIVDFNGLNKYDDFTTSEIPTNPDFYDDVTRFHLSARQSRLNFNVYYLTSKGLITGKISGDFYSGSTGEYSFFRLREAYLKYGNLILGQTGTTFGNPDIVPSTIDFEGPNSGPAMRNPMISFRQEINQVWSYGLAIEMRGNDLILVDTVNRPFLAIPTLVGNLNKKGKWGVMTLSLMTAAHEFYDSRMNPKTKYSFGSAFSLIFNTSETNRLSLFAVAGDGVANFIADLSGGNYNGILVQNSDELRLLNSFGGFIGYTHFWKPQYSTNLIYSFAALEKTALLSPTDFRWSNYALANLFYQPNEHLKFGTEIVWGNLYTQDLSTGNAFRLQFLAQLNF